MKQKIIFLTLVLAVVATISAAKTFRSHRRNNENPYPSYPTTLSQLARSRFPPGPPGSIIDDPDYYKKSAIEMNAGDHKIINPLSKEQNDMIWPKKKKEEKAYYPIEAKPTDTDLGNELIVANMSALKPFKGYNTFPEAQSGIRRPPIYHKDAKPYYNPVHERNLFLQDKNLFQVPIDFKEKHLYETELKQEKERQRLALKPGYYYDASRYYYRNTTDPIKIALADAEIAKTKPAAIKYKDWVLREKDRKEKIEKILGKYKELDVDAGLGRIRHKIRVGDNQVRRSQLVTYDTKLNANSPSRYETVARDIYPVGNKQTESNGVAAPYYNSAQ